MDERNLGQIALWKCTSDNQNAPQARGEYTAHRDITKGEVLEVALWRNHSENPKAPIMRGKISDRYQPNKQSQTTAGDYRQASRGGQQQIRDPGFDDDMDDPIPF